MITTERSAARARLQQVVLPSVKILQTGLPLHVISFTM
jgi:hypothetical protein